MIGVIFFRKSLFKLTDKLSKKFNHKASDYAVDRFQIFIHGLTPLCKWSRLPVVTLSSLAVWFIELSVYIVVTWAFDYELSFSHCVLFLVAVNFSSLIPSAPGAIGVIEAIATAVLAAVGVPRELALSMVLSQHLIQYIVVGIPGAFVLLTWKTQLDEMDEEL